MSEGESTGQNRRAFMKGVLLTATGALSLASSESVFAATHQRDASAPDALHVPGGSLAGTFLPTYGQVRFFGNDPSYASLDVETVADLLYRLDPDALLLNVATDYNMGVPDMEMTVDDTYAGQPSLALQQEMGVPAGIHLGYDYQEDDRRWYEDLPPAERFRWPDGSVVEDLYDIAGVTVTGRTQGDPDEWIAPSPFADGTRRLLTEPAVTFLESGFGSVNFDATVYPALQGLDCSRWATAAFRSHLHGVDDARLADWGIDDVDRFDLRSYVRSNGLDPDTVDSPAHDPVVREYALQHHRGIKSLWEDVTGEVTSQDYPAPSIGTTPNANPFWNAPVSGVYLHDAFEVVGFEDEDPTVPPTVIREVLYKLGRAAGRFEKPPVNHEAAIGESRAEELGFETDTRYTTLMRLQAAEAYANGGRLALNLFVIRSTPDARRQPIRWLNEDGSVPDDLPPFVDFLHAHRRFLSDVESANRVALVYSLPTMLWNTFPNWDREPAEFLDSFEGAAALLREHGYPYDVLVFGHPRLWDDTAQLDRLSSYDAVVLPNVESVTDDQLAALRSRLDGGGTVVTTGSAPARTGMYEPRARTAVWDHPNAIVIDSTPGRRRRVEGAGGQELSTALADSIDRQVALSTGANVGRNVFEQPSAGRVVVHLVNYEYRLGSDSVDAQETVSMTVRDLPFEPAEARWYEPDGTSPLSVELTEEGVQVELPHLGIWGFAVFAEGAGTLHPGSEAEANEAVESSATAVDAARSEGRSVDRYHAEHALANAEAMVEYDSYEAAVDYAEQAVERAEAAYRPPTIGIDVGHGQPESRTGFARFGVLRHRFSTYEYRPVEAMSEESLAPVDVLVVPPALTWRDAEYGYATAEVEAIRGFVEDGGSLLVLGRAGLSRDVNRLLDAFEMPVDERRIIGDRSHAVTELDALTIGVDAFEANYVTPLADPPEAVRVVARMPEDTTAWYHRGPPQDERGEDEPSAAGAPVYGVRRWGAGLVAYLGSLDPYARDAAGAFDEGTSRMLVGNSLEVLGRAARLARRSSEPARDATASPSTATGSGSEGATADVTTTPGTPGFTVVAALLGIAAGAAAGLSSRLEAGDPGSD